MFCHFNRSGEEDQNKRYQMSNLFFSPYLAKKSTSTQI
ncbi:MAG: hypothetical protein ACI9LN_004853 [Saprospiraceae bacterium]